MRLEYDAEADAAYLYLDESGAKVETTIVGEDEAEGINLDLGAGGRLLGVEILDAKSRLPAALLKKP